MFTVTRFKEIDNIHHTSWERLSRIQISDAGSAAYNVAFTECQNRFSVHLINFTEASRSESVTVVAECSAAQHENLVHKFLNEEVTHGMATWSVCQDTCWGDSICSWDSEVIPWIDNYITVLMGLLLHAQDGGENENVIRNWESAASHWEIPADSHTDEILAVWLKLQLMNRLILCQGKLVKAEVTESSLNTDNQPSHENKRCEEIKGEMNKSRFNSPRPKRKEKEKTHPPAIRSSLCSLWCWVLLQNGSDLPTRANLFLKLLQTHRAASKCAAQQKLWHIATWSGSIL